MQQISLFCGVEPLKITKKIRLIELFAGISDSQCYKQAGNSIVVNVLEAIFRNMNIKGVKRWQE